MILHALKEYYDRKSADPDSDIAPEGWEWKEIHFIIALDRNGAFLQFEDMREGEGNKKRGKPFLVPQGVKKGSNITPNLLWDTPDYIFGVEAVEEKTDGVKIKKISLDRRGAEKRKSFSDRIQTELLKTSKTSAVIRFLESVELSDMEKNHHWEEIVKTKAVMSFRFDDELDLYCQTQEVKDAVNNQAGNEKAEGICLVTGERDTISVIHTSIKGVWNAQPSGANIVSFQKDSGYDSYGKKQGLNAPIGEKAMFAYTTALNSLLKSSQRIQIGDASTVFWSDRKTQFEMDFPSFLAEPSKDNPDAGTLAINNLFDSVKSGGYVEDTGDEKFFLLGLSPNNARISIRLWKTGTVSEFARNIRQHFEDLKIIKAKTEPEYYSLWRLLVNASVQDKSENIPPNIAGEFLRSIIDGVPYPATILQLVLRRIKSDTKWGANKAARIALVKAYLNRYMRSYKPNEKEFTMELDKEQTSQGYQLGRLFAVLEKIQEEATNPNATIRERYYGAACSAPVTVFPTLLRLKNHHLAKIEKKGLVIYFERLIGEIMKPPFYDFPPHLNLHEQGKFAIGYYHQRQDFFTSKDNKDKEL